MKSSPCIVLLPLAFAICGWSQSYSISTIAGTDRLLDGSPATSAPLRDPASVAIDAGGNIYIADKLDHRIRRVSAAGIISTYAGTGMPGFSGDGGKAKTAQLNSPANIVLDAGANLYIADQGNNCVRRVASNGIISTVAGNGTPGSSGDKGSALNASMVPLAVAVDSKGILYISDIGNGGQRIRKVDSSGTITTIAGGNQRGYTGPGPAAGSELGIVIAMTLDPTGNLYLADIYNYRVLKIDTSGNLSLVAGAGNYGTIGDGLPATGAVMVPLGIAVDSAGAELYISDYNRDLIDRVDLATGIIHTHAGAGTTGYSGDNGPALKAQLNAPAGMVIDIMQNVYFADRGNARIREVSASVITTIAGTDIRDGGPASAAFLNLPAGLAIDGSKRLLIADSANLETRLFTEGGSIANFGKLVGSSPTGVAVDQSGNFYVTDDYPNVLKMTPSGATSVLAAGRIQEPTGIAADPSGNVYVADYGSNNVRRVDPTGGVSTIAGNGDPNFSGDGGAATDAGMDPFDIAADVSGNLYIADQVNNRIRMIGPDGTITTLVGDGTPGYSGDGGLATAAQLFLPTGVAVDSAGNLYIADFGNSVVRKVVNGYIYTIAGSGLAVPALGDGGIASNAQLNPFRLALDADGNVYVSDALNDRVRKLTPIPQTPTTVSIVSGDGQSAAVDSALPESLIVQVLDANGVPVLGVPVTFAETTSSGAVISPLVSVTLNDGSAATTVTLGDNEGDITITATAAGVDTPVTFTETAIAAGTPESLPRPMRRNSGLAATARTRLSPVSGFHRGGNGPRTACDRDSGLGVVGVGPVYVHIDIARMNAARDSYVELVKTR